jgi:hypothetical protein
VKKPARIADLLVNIDKKLSLRIVRLQQVRLGVTTNDIRWFAVQICGKHNINYWKYGKVDKVFFISSLTKIHGFTLKIIRESQLWSFAEIEQGTSRFWGQTVEAMTQQEEASHKLQRQLGPRKPPKR